MRSRLSRAAVIRAILAIAACAIFNAAAFPQDKQDRSNKDANSTGPRSVGKGLNLYSLNKEEKIGKALAREFERSSKLIDDPVLIEYLNRVAQNIAKNSNARFPITVKLIDSAILSAFTLPGGFQYINTGLFLQTEREAELAGVLAHGIAYTAIRASTKQATKAEFVQLAWVPAMIFIPAGWSGYGMSNGASLAMPLTFLKFSRDAERAADYLGLQYLSKSGYDPESYVRFAERILPQVSARENISKALSPSSPQAERLQNMRSEIAKILPPQGAAIVTSGEFDAMKERLRALIEDQLDTGPAAAGRKPILRPSASGPAAGSPIPLH
jgi:beta-barrel assembly-enhancing protease